MDILERNPNGPRWSTEERVGGRTVGAFGCMCPCSSGCRRQRRVSCCGGGGGLAGCTPGFPKQNHPNFPVFAVIQAKGTPELEDFRSYLNAVVSLFLRLLEEDRRVTHGSDVCLTVTHLRAWTDRQEAGQIRDLNPLRRPAGERLPSSGPGRAGTPWNGLLATAWRCARGGRGGACLSIGSIE